MSRFTAVSLCYILLALFGVFSSTTQAGDAGVIAIEKPWARPTAPGVATGAVYLTLQNTGNQVDRLLSASGDIAGRIELHTHEMQDGLMKMVHMADGVIIEAGASVQFEPGGKHIMLMGLSAPLVTGESFPLSLQFERSGTVKITVPVGDLTH